MKNATLLLIGGLLGILPIFAVNPNALSYRTNYDLGFIAFSVSIREILFAELVLLFLIGGIISFLSKYKFVRRDQDEE